jgi:hypothetical protein
MNSRSLRGSLFLAALVCLSSSCNLQAQVSRDILGVAASGKKLFALRKTETSTLHSSGLFEPDPPKIVSADYELESLDIASTSPEWKTESTNQKFDLLKAHLGWSTIGRFSLTEVGGLTLWGDTDLTERVRSELNSKCARSSFGYAWTASGVPVADCGSTIFYFPKGFSGPACELPLRADSFPSWESLRRSVSFNVRSGTLGVLDRKLNLIESSDCGRRVHSRALARLFPEWAKSAKWKLALLATDGESATFHASSAVLQRSALIQVGSRKTMVTEVPSRAVHVWTTSVTNGFVWEDGQRGALHFSLSGRNQTLPSP